jgi:hypothetical protein
MKCSRFPIGALSVLLLAGCGSSGDPFEASNASDDSSLENPDNVRIWATSLSAFAIYGHAYEPVAVADGERTFPDPACPATEDDGTTLTAEGGCTDSAGIERVGKLTVKRSANGDRAVSFDGYGALKDGEPWDVRDGEANVRRIDDTHHDFSVKLVHEGGMRHIIDYEGQVEGGYDTRTVWSGSGTVVREGLFPPVGSVEVNTSAEVVDDALCSGQPASGNTTIHNDTNETAVVTYDGEVDCDADHAATYTLNGDPKGSITGITCATSPGRNAPAGSLLLGLTLLGARLGARRLRSSRAKK